MSSHSFWTLSIGEGVMGFSVVTRSCRALRAEKLPITRVVSSLVSISLSNKGVGLRNHQKLRGKYLSIPATKKSSSESFCNCFSWSTQTSTDLGGEGSGVGSQDRVAAPVSTKKFSDLSASSNCALGSIPMVVICDRWPDWSGLLQSC